MAAAAASNNNSYEAFDLDTEESNLYFFALFHVARSALVTSGAESNQIAWIVHRHRSVARKMKMWLVFIAVGVCTGIVAFALATAVEMLTGFKFWLHSIIVKPTTEHPLDADFVAAYFAHLATCILYAGIAATLTAFVSPIAAGSGIPEVKSYLNGCAIPRVLDLITGAVKMVGLALSVSAGLAIGKEGPLVHTGAVLANVIGSLKFRSFKHQAQLSNFVSGGAAAGVAAAFGAPLGGVLFSLEEASTRFSLEGLWYNFACAMMSALTLTLCFALRSGHVFDINNIGGSGLISFGLSNQSMVFTIWEIPIFAIIGALSGVLGAVFNSINVRLAKWRRLHVSGPRRRVVEVIVIAALTSTIGYWAPSVYSRASHCQSVPKHAHVDVSYFRRYTCPQGEFNDVATLIFSPMEQSLKVLLHAEISLSTSALVLVTIVTYVEAVITFGIGIPAGLFVPLIFLGASGGRIIGEFLRASLGGSVTSFNPGSYALIGAASMLGGVTRMTVSLSVIIAETTGNITWVLPIMIVLLVSKWVGDAFNESIYEAHVVDVKNIPFLGPHAPSHFAFIDARTVMHKLEHGIDVAHLHGETVGSILQLLRRSSHNGFPVLADCGGGESCVEGHVTRDALTRLLHAMLASQRAVEADTPTQQRSLLKTTRSLTRRRFEKRKRTTTPSSSIPPEGEEEEFYRSLLPPEDGNATDGGNNHHHRANDLEECGGDPRGEEEDTLMSLIDGVEAEDILLEMAEGKLSAHDVKLDRLDARRTVRIDQIFHPCPIIAREHWPMTRVYTCFRLFGLRQLTVCDCRGRLRGVITRHEITNAQSMIMHA